ncbi:hypothetical protein [Bacillus sp. FJAT-29937]|uniref:hypothetical protein n=1 Tax=Bacillus sp. FJAT-29937 TaxID=1720553 RepID=UPI0008300E98|nr:hypothetical protein [Bacillus sp. FJAT-29937]
MPNPISKVVTVILAVLLLYYVPTYQSYQKQDDLAYQVAYQAVTKFVDNVRTKGYITPQMYEDFQRDLTVGSGSILYRTEIVHEKKIYTPVYTDPTNPASFTNQYVVDFDEYYWEQIHPFLFDESSPTPKEQRMYKLTAGDFFSVHVENMTKTKATMLFDFLTGGLGGNDVVISIPYGGMVLNEDY